MPTFPRTAGALPRLATPPQFQAGIAHWAQSGKGSIRHVHAIGRTWVETYPVLDTDLAAVKTLLSTIESAWNTGLVYDVTHPYWHKRLGSGSGTVTVNGANQVGNSLAVSGGGGAGWLKAGDLISVVGSPTVFDVTADMGGASPIPIFPAILPGQSPGSGVVVTHAPGSIVFKCILVGVQAPNVDTTRYLEAGLQLTWREQPGG